MNNFIVRWTDINGASKSRPYTDEKTARKARDWLTNNGIKDADIAIAVVEKPEEPKE